MSADAGRVFVVGSLHLDVIVNAPHLPARDETVVGSKVDYVCGGKGANQAVAAARHGARVAMAGRVGDDAFAQRLLACLDSAGVDRAQVQRGTASASGMSVAVVDNNGDYGAVIVSAANLCIDAEQVRVPPDSRVVLLQNEVPEAVNISVARQARDAGATVVLNAAPWRPVPAALVALVDLLVLNRVEALAMTGRDDIEAAVLAEAVCAPGACNSAIVTLGADGAWYCDRSGPAHWQPALDVAVISTHGAGDTFVGALAARFAAGDAVPAAMRYAAAAAALHVATPAAERESIGPRDVEAPA